MSERTIGVLGATSLVGRALIDLATARGWRVCAHSRRSMHKSDASGPGVLWWRSGTPPPTGITHWVSLIPIGNLPEQLCVLEDAKRVVAMSSTSIFTKEQSPDRDERKFALALADGEQVLARWAQERGAEWIVLRPTLIYGFGRDRNISEIARVIRKFGFFPLLGAGVGRRQPVHVVDVAEACISALDAGCSDRSFEISGGEILTYREMVSRVFRVLGRRERVYRFPLWAFRLAASSANLVAGERRFSPAMAERMNQDLVFDHEEASRELDFAPRRFELERSDLGL